MDLPVLASCETASADIAPRTKGEDEAPSLHTIAASMRSSMVA
jgi:hypothetical protein